MLRFKTSEQSKDSKGFRRWHSMGIANDAGSMSMPGMDETLRPQVAQMSEIERDQMNEIDLTDIIIFCLRWRYLYLSSILLGLTIGIGLYFYKAKSVEVVPALNKWSLSLPLATHTMETSKVVSLITGWMKSSEGIKAFKGSVEALEASSGDQSEPSLSAEKFELLKWFEQWRSAPSPQHPALPLFDISPTELILRFETPQAVDQEKLTSLAVSAIQNVFREYTNGPLVRWTELEAQRIQNLLDSSKLAVEVITVFESHSALSKQSNGAFVKAIYDGGIGQLKGDNLFFLLGTLPDDLEAKKTLLEKHRVIQSKDSLLVRESNDLKRRFPPDGPEKISLVIDSTPVVVNIPGQVVAPKKNNMLMFSFLGAFLGIMLATLVAGFVQVYRSNKDKILLSLKPKV